MCTACQFLVEKSLIYKDNYVHNLFCIHTSWKTMIRSHHAISLKTMLPPLATHNYDNKHCSLIDYPLGEHYVKTGRSPT